MHPRYYVDKVRFSVAALQSHPDLRTLLEAARSRGSWPLAARAFPEVVKLHVLARNASADVTADVDAIQSLDRLVRENTTASEHVVLAWEDRELTFGVGENGEQTFPVLSSLVREDPSLAKTILSVLERTNGAPEDAATGSRGRSLRCAP